MVDMKKYEINVSDDKKHYITQGTQYYVLGRISVYNFFHLFNLNISTVLFHNAVEYFLKALLLDHYSIEELKNKRHNLPALLKLYKNKFPNGELIKFEEFINKFHRFYNKRYVQSDESHIISESWSPTKEANKIAKKFMKEKINFKGQIEWTTEEIDKFIYDICKDLKTDQTSVFDYINLIADLSPEFFKNNNFFKRTEEIFTFDKEKIY